MGATISYRPIKPGKNLPINAPSSFIEILEEAFGTRPWTLTAEHTQILHGIRAAYKNEREAIDDIMEAIAKYGAIIIEVE